MTAPWEGFDEASAKADPQNALNQAQAKLHELLKPAITHMQAFVDWAKTNDPSVTSPADGIVGDLEGHTSPDMWRLGHP